MVILLFLLPTCRKRYNIPSYGNIPMKLQESLVSVILPVYNAEKHLPDCLESLLKQTYQKIQIIAIDDNSKDNSFSILKQFQKSYKNIQIYKNKKHYGLAICYNRALRRTTGHFVAFMNPHDISLPNRFKRQVQFLMKYPKMVAVGTQYTAIDIDNRKLSRSTLPEDHQNIYDRLLRPSALHPETVMINRMRLPKDLLYFKSNKYPLLFTEVFVKFFQYGTVANLKQAFYHHREGTKRQTIPTSKTKHIASLVRLFVSSRANYDYRPSLRSFVSPLLREAKTAFR